MTAPEANSAAAGPRSTPAAIAAARPAAARTSRAVAIRSACGLASARTGAPGRSVTSVAVASAAAPTAAAAAPTTAAAVAARRPLLALARRCVLGPLDQLLRLNEVAVLVLGDQLEAEPAAILVDLLDEDVEHVAAPDHVLDVADAARADVGDVQQAVGSLLQLDEGAELRGLHDLARVGVADLRGLRERLDRCDRRVGLLTLGRVDQDRAVLLDVDLDVVVGLERADRLAALADHEPDLLRVDLDRRDARSVRGELATALREHLEVRDHRLERPLRERAVADVAPLRAAHEARLPDRVGREVVVVHVAALGLEREVVDPLALLGGAEGQQGHDLGLPAREERRAVRAGADAHLTRDLADLLRAAAVGPPLLDRDLAPDQVLVDRLRRLLDVLLGHRVLDDRRLVVGRGRPSRERQLYLLLDLLEEQAPFRRLELLRLLLGVGQCFQVFLGLLPYRTENGVDPLPVEDQRQARAHLNLPTDVVLGGLHRDRRGQLADELLDHATGLAQAFGADPLLEARAVIPLELLS